MAEFLYKRVHERGRIYLNVTLVGSRLINLSPLIPLVKVVPKKEGCNRERLGFNHIGCGY